MFKKSFKQYLDENPNHSKAVVLGFFNKYDRDDFVKSMEKIMPGNKNIKKAGHFMENNRLIYEVEIELNKQGYLEMISVIKNSSLYKKGKLMITNKNIYEE